MSETLAFRFRAKREERADTRALTGRIDAPITRDAYKLPALTATHVVTPRAQWGTRAVLMFGPASRGQQQRLTTILDAVGLDPWAVFADDPARELRHGARVTITPRGNGFMADIELTLPLNPPRDGEVTP
jgi:hypothetical protein